MKCQSCISFKRTDRNSGQCHHAGAIALHEFFNQERMGVSDQHGCRFHANKAEFVESLACQFRAAFKGAIGGGARD